MKKILIVLIGFFLIYIFFNIINTQNYRYGLSSVVEKIDNRYSIGLNGKDKKICDNFLKYGCLEGNIISYKHDNVDLYIYYIPYDNFGNFSNNKIFYPVLGPFDNNIIEKGSMKPDLIKINLATGYKEFFHSKDIDKFNNKKDINIFKNLLN